MITAPIIIVNDRHSESVDTSGTAVYRSHQTFNCTVQHIGGTMEPQPGLV